METADIGLRRIGKVCLCRQGPLSIQTIHELVIEELYFFAIQPFNTVIHGDSSYILVSVFL